ncbi:AAA family ATPase [Sorangium sp. So ce295]|uniref:AAA family ATPase n=1 Tax=Sorangium sp. So ce295 TaxID=3133295 RepID=UPI003F5E5521
MMPLTPVGLVMFTSLRMSDELTLPSAEPAPLPMLDERLVQWMAVQALQDQYARLVEGGADIDKGIELSSLFIDLPVSVSHDLDGVPERTRWAMPLLLGIPTTPRDGRPAMTPFETEDRQRWLLVGGPGSGKSTLTTMVAQALRLPWIENQVGVLPEPVREAWERARDGLVKLATAGRWSVAPTALPLRVNLPSLARWMASRSFDAALSLWEYLAARVVDDLASIRIPTEMSSHTLRTLVDSAGRVVWILDGLDEVPSSAGRRRVIEVVRAAVFKVTRCGHGMLVATRPQGYEGEFDDLNIVGLQSLPAEVAQAYATRLLRSWLGGRSTELAERLERMRTEFAKPEIAELLRTPLHTTMAALLIAGRSSLPAARSKLFEHYFSTIFRRELDKPFEHGIQDVDEPILRALHAQAGLALQVRSQAQSGARSSLRRRELRAMLTAIYTELGNHGDDVRTHVERIMRFAADRLVLLLHSAEGEYEFGVRSLQEFFAAEALGDAATATVRARLDVIALDPHWSNVLAFVVSSHGQKTGKDDRERALVLTESLCRDLNAGKIGGEAAARCLLGSRLALAMLLETARYGQPWLHEPLWDIALEAAAAPAQSTVARVAREMRRHRYVNVGSDDVELHTRLGLLAANWVGSNPGRRQQQVLQEAKTWFVKDGGERANGWRLLHGMLLAELPDALRVADENAPTTKEAAQEIYSVLAGERTARPPRWLRNLVNRHAAWFPPGSLMSGIHEFDEEEDSVAFRILKLLRESELRRVRLSLENTPRVWPGSLGSIETNIEEWQKIEPLIPDETSAWIAWKRVARFMADPSPSSLADVFEAAADEDAHGDFKWASYSLPWPISVGMDYAQTSPELLTLSKDAREGRLGTVADWRAAETRWRSGSFPVLDELGYWLEAGGPWNRDIASRGQIVLWWFPGPHPDAEAGIRDVFSWLLQWIERRTLPPRRSLELLTQIDSGAVLVPMSVVRLVQAVHEDYLTALVPNLSGPNAEEWFALLNERGQVASLLGGHINLGEFALRKRAPEIMDALIGRLREYPQQWGLMCTLMGLLLRRPNHDLSGLVLPELPPDAPPHAFAMRACLALHAGQVASSEVALVVRQIRFEDGQTCRDLREWLANVLLEMTRTDSDAITKLLTALDTQPAPEIHLRDALLGALFAHLCRPATPAFASANAWREHEFPEPFLAALPPPPPPPRLVRIAELSNLRLFKEVPVVDVPFPLPSGEQGQWIVLVGENGVGKTTLLRALALTLASPSVASKLLDERLPMVRNGGEGRVSIELDTGKLTVSVRRGERTELVESLSGPDAARPWVVAYGVRRGNARGEKDREPEIGPIGELHTLFDRPASLHNASQWLRDLDADVLREQRRAPKSPNAPPGPREGVWRSVQLALEVLLGVTKVEVDDDGMVYVRHPQFDRVRLDALSDGYLTTAGWIIDMIARWIDRQQELDEPVGADVLRQMCGFVLIDEIDMHLHPMWQVRIIDDVRRLFPRLSFVVTTHNPLTLQGARPGEVYVMRRDGGHIELAQRDIRPGQDVDRVLFEQFGVEHTFDRETRDMLSQHRKMLESGVPFDDPERKKIEARLMERFGEVGGTLRGERRDAAGPAAPLRPEEASLMASFLKKKA